MPSQDAIRWNARYQQDWRESFEQPRQFLVDHAHLLPTCGLALDVAMGLGGNAGFLLQHGLKVIGVDISEVAVRQVKTRLPAISAVVADLVHFSIPHSAFDVIVNFFYLNRPLWVQYPQALRPNGILILETLTVEMLTIHPDTPMEYLLKPHELKTIFPELEILDYHEGWQNLSSRHPRAVASLIAQRK